MFSLHYLIREMLAEKRRLFLTILAIAWGTASIACMLAIGEGLRETYGRAMAASGNSVLVVQGGATSTSYRGLPINQSVSLNLQDLKTITQAIPDIQITPEYTFNAKLIYRVPHKPDVTMMNPISAVEPIFGTLRNIQVQPGGRFINEIDNQQRRHVVVIGNERAKVLFGPDINPVGQSVLVEDQTFQVIGITKPKLQLSAYTTMDSYSAWIPLSTYKALANPQTISFILIVPNDPEKMPVIKQQVLKLIARNHQLDPLDENIVVFQDNQKAQETTNQVFSGMKWFLGIVGVLTLIVAGVGISNVMMISVQRATKEIGIRMAIGARTHQILTYYMVEALLTTAIGGIVGIIIANGVVALLGLIPFNSVFFQYIPKPEAVLSWQVIFMVIGTLSVIGFLAGFFPARKATQILPAEALRHE